MNLKITGLKVDAGTGPGSRGGIVIGKTSGGKPIYRDFSHPDHKGFTKGDHLEASKLHSKEMERLRKTKTEKGGPDRHSFHSRQFSQHAEAAMGV